MKRRTFLTMGTLAIACVASPTTAETLRIVSVGSSVTEILYALEAQRLIVGTDTTSLYPEAARRLPQVGYMRTLSAEGVLSLRPNLIITTTAAGPPTALEQIRLTGVEVLTLPDRYDYESVIAKIEAIGKATGKVAEAEALVARGRAEMAALAGELKDARSTPRVLFLLSMGGGGLQAAGRHTAADGIIRLGGGINAINGYDGYRALTPESVIASRADFVLVTRQTVEAMGGIDAILDQPALRETPAGKARRVLQFDTLLLLGFGPRTPRAATELALALHPELEITR